MKKQEIIDLVKNSEVKNETFPLAQLAKLKEVATVYLEMNRETDEYFYRVYIKELVNKDFDINIITENKWKVSEDEQNLVLTL